MKEKQIKKAAEIAETILSKGIKKTFVADKMGITVQRLSKILNGSDTYVSEKLLNKIEKFVSLINTNDIEVDG